MGELVHEAVARLARVGEEVSIDDLFAVCGGVVREFGGAGRAGVASQLVPAVSVAARMFPPEGWRSVRSVELGGGLADLMWCNKQGQVLIDELKSGRWRHRTLSEAVLAQVERFRMGGVDRYGGLFVGVRLLELGAPRASRWFPADGSPPVALESTPWWFGFAAPWERR